MARNNKKDTLNKPKRNIIELATNTYLRRIKKWMFCPSCQHDKMIINNKTKMWTCQGCGYQLSTDEFENDYIFWFCDECKTYLNNQDGFDPKAKKHVCTKCGYISDTTLENLKAICADCGRVISDSKATVCADCREERYRKAREWVAKAVKEVIVTVVVAGVTYLITKGDGDEDSEHKSLFISDSDGPTNDVVRVDDNWLCTASEDELRAVEEEMRGKLDTMDYDSDEYLQLDLARIDIVNAIASRFPLNLPKREHGWYLPNDD